MTFRNIKDLCSWIVNHPDIKAGASCGITSGCFDIIHSLHVQYFNRCNAHSHILVVLIDSGILMQRNKAKMQVFSEHDRCFMVDSIKGVDAVCVMNDLSELIQVMKCMSTIPGQAIAFKNSSKVYDTPAITVEGVDNIIIPDLNVFDSTSAIRNFISKQQSS